jgi:hypothetical protein
MSEEEDIMTFANTDSLRQHKLRIIPEIQEVISHNGERKIEEFLLSRDNHAFMKYYRWVLDRLEIPNECKFD